ncbi:MAG: hypothetical protein R3E50_16345 [Halioglobus sp.]
MHAVEVRHWRPRLRQFILEIFDRLQQVVPGVLLIASQQLFYALFVALDQLTDRRLHVRWLDGGERGQGLLRKQGIGHGKAFRRKDQTAILTESGHHQ